MCLQGAATLKCKTTETWAKHVCGFIVPNHPRTDATFQARRQPVGVKAAPWNGRRRLVSQRVHCVVRSLAKFAGATSETKPARRTIPSCQLGSIGEFGVWDTGDRHLGTVSQTEICHDKADTAVEPMKAADQQTMLSCQ